jgi:hypothetical protein
MRDITLESVHAFLNAKKFKKSNMEVITTSHESNLYYHNNLIARKDLQTGKIHITNCGWETNTTRDRLNGVLILSRSNLDLIRQKNWVWYLDGKAWNGNLIQIN